MITILYQYVLIQFSHYLMPETTQITPCVQYLSLQCQYQYRYWPILRGQCIGICSVSIGIGTDQYSGDGVLVSVVLAREVVSVQSQCKSWPGGIYTFMYQYLLRRRFVHFLNHFRYSATSLPQTELRKTYVREDPEVLLDMYACTNQCSLQDKDSLTYYSLNLQKPSDLKLHHKHTTGKVS